MNTDGSVFSAVWVARGSNVMTAGRRHSKTGSEKGPKNALDVITLRANRDAAVLFFFL